MAVTLIHQEDLKSTLGGEDLLELAQKRSFASLIFQTISGSVPSSEQESLFELILNLSIDHGPDTPSAKKVIEKAQEGVTISEAVAEGIRQITDTHGGAIEPAMNFFYRIKNENLEAKTVVQEYLEQHKLIGGFGHRLYKEEDPRAKLILGRLSELGFADEYAKLSEEVGNVVTEFKGIKLPLNIDGAIAVVLCTFGWDSKLGKAVFIAARTPGLCAHFLNDSK